MPPDMHVEIVDRGRRTIPVVVTDVQTRRVPGVGQEYVIRGIVTDEQLARDGNYDRTLGLPTEFRITQAGQRGGRSLRMVALDEASPFITDEEFEEFTRTTGATKKVNMNVEVEPSKPTDRETMIITED